MCKQCNPTTTRLQTMTMRRTDSEGSSRCTINNYKCQSFGAQSIDKLPYVHVFGGMCNLTNLQTKGLYQRAARDPEYDRNRRRRGGGGQDTH